MEKVFEIYLSEGVLKYVSGNVYEGEFKNDVKEGFGIRFQI